PNYSSLDFLSFDAKTYSGDANAYDTRPTGITISTGGLAWVVGYYLTNKGHASHAFAVQVNTASVNASTPSAIVGGSWISFDVSVAGGGIARGVDSKDGTDANTLIVGTYSDASGKQQGYVLTISEWKYDKSGAATVVPVGSGATVTCSGAIGGYIHGISAIGGRVVGIAYTSNLAGYAYDADGSWTKGNTYTVCLQILGPGASKNGQTWASGISSDNVRIVGQGAGEDWIYP
ncbi:MAG TPA: hypothetical protein VGX75_14515, partial [bacterium]|nr:hypothetical protein [bacterium]